MSSARDERGIALAAVLWAIAILSLIAVAMLSSGMNSLRMSRNAWTQTQLQASADAAVQQAILSLFDPRVGRRMRVDGVVQDLSFDGVTATVSVQDEQGRIDINYAGHGLLRDLFKSAGVGAQQADALADRIIDWRSTTGLKSLNGASAADYSAAGYDYRPRGGPFQSVDELNLVMGMTPQLFARIAPALTVYSHSANFDMRTAPREVLLAIPGMDDTKADAAIAARDAAPIPQSTGLPAEAFVSAPSFAGKVFSIAANVQRGNMRSSRQAMVLLSGDPAHPFWVLGWK